MHHDRARDRHRQVENPLARPSGLRELVLTLPDPLLRLGSWTALGLELTFAPLALLRCPLLPPALRQRFDT